VPGTVAITIQKLPARGVEVDVELKTEDRIRGHDLRPFRFSRGGADVVFTEHRQRFEAKPFADVGLRRQLVSRAKFIRELHVAEGLREVAHAIMHLRLQMMQQPERVRLGIGEDDASLRGREIDDVFLRGTGLALLQSIHHALRELAGRVVLHGPV
jgi:hypothetical protein